MKIKNRKNNFEKNKNSVTLYHGGCCCCCCCCCVNTTTSSIFAYNTFLKNSKHRGWWTFALVIILGLIESFLGLLLVSEQKFESIYPIASLSIAILFIALYSSLKSNQTDQEKDE